MLMFMDLMVTSSVEEALINGKCTSWYSRDCSIYLWKVETLLCIFLTDLRRLTELQDLIKETNRYLSNM